MHKEVTIIVSEDNDGHAELIKKNIRRAGIHNKIIHLRDGEETLNFIFQRNETENLEDGRFYLLLLDIRMPKIDGIEVLRAIKKDPKLKRIPVIMLTTTDDPHEIERCHELGCNSYITKPINYENFVMAIQQLGLFLLIVEVPRVEN